MLYSKEEQALNCYVKSIRMTMNEIIKEINGDFTGWCELGTMLLFRLVRDIEPTWDNKVARGYYKDEGHFWNIINGVIVDTTVDQFGNIKPGIVNKRYINNYIIDKFVKFNEEDLRHMTDTDDLYYIVLNEYC